MACFIGGAGGGGGAEKVRARWRGAAEKRGHGGQAREGERGKEEKVPGRLGRSREGDGPGGRRGREGRPGCGPFIVFFVLLFSLLPFSFSRELKIEREEKRGKNNG